MRLQNTSTIQGPSPAQIKPVELAAPDRTRMLRWLSIAAAAGIIGGVILALTYAATDAIQGDVQRIFYIHLPSFTGAFVAFSTALVGSLLYLRTRQSKWDTLALSAVEVGFVLSFVNLSLGSIWARATWNTWWTGDSRMTSSAIMLLICAAYPMFRAGIENPERRRLVAALIGIALMGALVFTFIVTRFRQDTIHPVVIGPSPQNTTGGFEMTGTMGITLFVNLTAWGLLLSPALIWWRVRLQTRIERIAQFRRSV